MSSSTTTTTTLHEISPHASVVRQQQALAVNTAAAVGLQQVLASNLGPTGTLKLLVGGGAANQLKLTKDGVTLLKEMQIQHPTAALIARTATAQDDITGDGTTSTVLLTGELLKQAMVLVQQEGVHPRIVADGYDIARDAVLQFLQDQFRHHNKHNNNKSGDTSNTIQDTDLLLQVARTSLGTKVDTSLVDTMSHAVVQAIQTIYDVDQDQPQPQPQHPQPLDLNRIEILTIPRHQAADSRLVQGLVLDHGARHPDMPQQLRNCYIMIANISLEYEQAETTAGFVYQTAEERETLVQSERVWLDERCRQIVELKRRVCNNNNKDDKTFCIINQKGVDPLSLDIFAKEGILCLRRAKRRNMERLALATGGQPILSLQDLSPDQLGFAGKVTQVQYGEDKYTFVEDCPHSKSCTLLLQGPNTLTIHQIQDAVQDGLRAVKNAVEDQAVVPGGGAFELAASLYLQNVVAAAGAAAGGGGSGSSGQQKMAIAGKTKLGVAAFAQALLIIPKTLAANAGFDVQETLLQLTDEYKKSNDKNGNLANIGLDNDKKTKQAITAIGLDVRTGQPMLPEMEGVWDNVRVKRQSLYLATVLANQLLLVDEVMRAGKQMGRQQEQQQPE